ncbi:MAG: hypothetical protein ACKPJJ_33710, partial [Planctomycetaceae bacterium]
MGVGVVVDFILRGAVAGMSGKSKGGKRGGAEGRVASSAAGAGAGSGAEGAEVVKGGAVAGEGERSVASKGRVMDPRALLKTLKQLSNLRDADLPPAGLERLQIWREMLWQLSALSRASKGGGVTKLSLYRQRQAVRLREFDAG